MDSFGKEESSEGNRQGKSWQTSNTDNSTRKINRSSKCSKYISIFQY